MNRAVNPSYVRELCLCIRISWRGTTIARFIFDQTGYSKFSLMQSTYVLHPRASLLQSWIYHSIAGHMFLTSLGSERQEILQAAIIRDLPMVSGFINRTTCSSPIPCDWASRLT